MECREGRDSSAVLLLGFQLRELLNLFFAKLLNWGPPCVSEILQSLLLLKVLNKIITFLICLAIYFCLDPKHDITLEHEVFYSLFLSNLGSIWLCCVLTRVVLFLVGLEDSNYFNFKLVFIILPKGSTDSLLKSVTTTVLDRDFSSILFAENYFVS